jgi:hypothetical protein
MRGLKSTLALFLVLVGLGAYIYFVTWRQPDVSTENRVFASLEAGDIQELIVTSETGDTTTLKKDGDAWQIVAPITTAAAANEVSAMTSALSQMDTVRVVDEQPADVASFGLAPAKVSVRFTSAAGKPSGTLLIGARSPTGAGVYAKREDQPRVFLIAEYQGSSFDKTTFDLRDKTVIAFERGQVSALEMEMGGRRVAFARKDNDWSLTAPIAARADFGSVDAVVSQLQNLQMSGVAAEQPTPDDLRKFGLERPTATVTLGLGSARATLAVGGSAPEDRVYVKDQSRPLVMTVGKTILEDLKKQADDFRRKELFDFRAFNATHVEVTRGGATAVFERVKGSGDNPQDTWRRVSPNPGDVDKAKMDSLLSGLADMRATEFRATTAGTGLDSPVLSVVVKFEEGAREDRATFGRSGSAVYAAIPADPGASVIEAEKLDEALKALDEISK